MEGDAKAIMVAGASVTFTIAGTVPSATTGAIVKTYTTTGTIAAGAYTQTWDGSNTAGARVGPGAYSFTVTATRADSTVSWPSRSPVVGPV